MKKFYRVLAIVLFIGVIASIFVPIVLQAITPDPTPDGARDPHSHVGDITLCFNQLQRACDAK